MEENTVEAKKRPSEHSYRERLALGPQFLRAAASMERAGMRGLASELNRACVLAAKVELSYADEVDYTRAYYLLRGIVTAEAERGVL